MQMSEVIREANIPPLPHSHSNEELYRKQCDLLYTFFTHGAITEAQYKTSLQKMTMEMQPVSPLSIQ